MFTAFRGPTHFLVYLSPTDFQVKGFITFREFSDSDVILEENRIGARFIAPEGPVG